MPSPVRVYPEYIDPERLMNRLYYVLEHVKIKQKEYRKDFWLKDADEAEGSIIALQEIIKSIENNTY